MDEELKNEIYKEEYSYITLCKKNVKTKEGTTFPALFAYPAKKNEDGTMSDILVPSTDKDGKSIMVAKSIRVILTGDIKKKLMLEDKFPYYLEFDEPQEDYEEYYITIYKDINGKPRLDKYGKRHPVMIIGSCNKYWKKELERITFDNYDEIQ